MTRKELSETLGIRPQSSGEIVKKLEKNGYVEKTPDENDGRAYRIHLTEAGINENNRLNSEAAQESVFDCLDSEEKIQLNGLLSKIVANSPRLDTRMLKMPDKMSRRPQMDYFFIDDDGTVLQIDRTGVSSNCIRCSYQFIISKVDLAGA